MRFEEKQWMPLWIVALFVIVPDVIVSPLIAQDPHDLQRWLGPAGLGLFWAAIIWVATTRRWIRVDDRFLRIGDRKPIPLAKVAAARIVRGRELKHLRQAMIQGRGLPVAAAAVPAIPAAGGALGNIVLGVSLLRGRRSRSGNLWGMLAEPWMREAVVVEVPGDDRAPVLLIGTRRPEQLLAALSGVSR